MISFCHIFYGCACPQFFYSLMERSFKIVCLLSVPQDQDMCWGPHISFSQGSPLKCSRLCAFYQSFRDELTTDINVLSVGICAPLLQRLHTLWKLIHIICWKLTCAVSRAYAKCWRYMSASYGGTAGEVFHEVLGNTCWMSLFSIFQIHVVIVMIPHPFSLFLVLLRSHSLANLFSDLVGAKRKCLLRQCFMRLVKPYSSCYTRNYRLSLSLLAMSYAALGERWHG